MTSTRPSFQDPLCQWDITAREFVVARLRKSLNSLIDIVERAEGSTSRRPVNSGDSKATSAQGLIHALGMTFEGPGELKSDGPRHDNDHADITQIKTVPTDAELRCKQDPFLPANIPGAPHHHPPESIERLLDIQFRLLREELMCVSIELFVPMLTINVAPPFDPPSITFSTTSSNQLL